MKIYLLPFLIITSLTLAGQTNSYQLFELSTNAGVAAMGGQVITGTYSNVGAWSENPALIQDSASNWISFDFGNYLGGSSLFGTSYTGKIKKYPIRLSVKHLGYGEFVGRDDTGALTTDFTAAEDMISIGTSTQSGYFSAGFQLNYLNSRLQDFVSHAITVDLGVIFNHPTENFTVGMIIKNLGVVLSDYTLSGEKSTIPFDVKIGGTYKPQNMPMKFSATVYQIAPNSRSFLLQEHLLDNEKKVLAFLNMGGELILNDKFQVLIGVNFRQRYEMKLDNGGGAGFNFGIRIRKSSFILEYGRGSYHVSQQTNRVTLLVDSHIFRKVRKNTNE